MLGEEREQARTLATVVLEDRVPATHPLRDVGRLVDPLLRDLARTFDALYNSTQRPSIPPERLPRAAVAAPLCDALRATAHRAARVQPTVPLLRRSRCGGVAVNLPETHRTLDLPSPSHITRFRRRRSEVPDRGRSHTPPTQKRPALSRTERFCNDIIVLHTEAPVGIEPTNGRFAVSCLTTWPRRPTYPFKMKRLGPPGKRPAAIGASSRAGFAAEIPPTPAPAPSRPPPRPPRCRTRARWQRDRLPARRAAQNAASHPATPAGRSDI